MAGEDWEPPGEATLGVIKGHLQKLTARAKTSLLSPSEVNVLCSGQSASTGSSSSSTLSAVLIVETITLHMAAAALQTQSSVSAGSRPQRRSLGTPGVLCWLPALPLPTAPCWQQPAGLHLRAAGGQATVPRGAGRERSSRL